MRTGRHRTSLSLALLAPFAALACAGDAPRVGDSPGATSVVDFDGRPVHLARPAERVVSLIPSITEIIIAIGAADRLIARTDYDEQPALARLPSVGGGLTPSLEALASLRPDLVVAWPDAQSRSLLPRLEDLGIPVYGVRTDTLGDFRRITRDLGVLLDLETAADSLRAWVDADLDAVRRAVAGRPRPTVLYVVTDDPPRTVGPGTFLHEIIRIAGGRNAFGDADQPWPQVALEEILLRQPDVVLLPAGRPGHVPVERLPHAPGWNTLDAVQSGRVFPVDGELFTRLGPRIGTAARQLAELLHPDAFPPRVTP